MFTYQRELERNNIQDMLVSIDTVWCQNLYGLVFDTFMILIMKGFYPWQYKSPSTFLAWKKTAQAFQWRVKVGNEEKRLGGRR